MRLAARQTLQTATFAGGCFWGVEELFRRLPGVKQATSGYMGGHTQNPTYRDVCTDQTGHAEVVEVKFNPTEITYRELLDVFWQSHDPTQLNQQGPDVGTQYRSVVFYHSPEQKKQAEQSLEKMNREKFSGKIATTIEPVGTFYKAEEYHQQYYDKNGMHGKVCYVPLK